MRTDIERFIQGDIQEFRRGSAIEFVKADNKELAERTIESLREEFNDLEALVLAKKLIAVGKAIEDGLKEGAIMSAEKRQDVLGAEVETRRLADKWNYAGDPTLEGLQLEAEALKAKIKAREKQLQESGQATKVVGGYTIAVKGL